MNLTGNKQIEMHFNKDYKLINSWREGNDPEIVYHSDSMAEEEFFTINPTNENSSVTLLGKEAPEH